MATTPLRPPPDFAADAAPPEHLYDRIRAAVASTPAATTRTRARIIAALVVVPVLTVTIALIASAIVYGQPAAGLDIDVASTAETLTILALLAGLALASTLFALRRGRGGLGVGSTGLISIAALVAPVYAALTVLRPVHSGAADDIALTGVAISPWGWRCMFVAAVVAAGVLAIFAGTLRRAVVAASGLRAAALGAAAGAWGGLAVFAFCPSGEPRHLLIGHVLPIALCTLLGGVASSRVLRP